MFASWSCCQWIIVSNGKTDLIVLDPNVHVLNVTGKTAQLCIFSSFATFERWSRKRRLRNIGKKRRCNIWLGFAALFCDTKYG